MQKVNTSSKVRNLSAVFAVAFVAVTLVACSAQAPSQTNIPNSNSEKINTAAVTSAELAKHNQESDCWIAYKGKVYEITSLLNRHPGGKEVLIPLCGTSNEFEKQFEAKHGTSKVEMMISSAVLKGDLQG